MNSIAFDFTQLVPEFIREDRNGYALARAIGAALEDFCRDAEAADAYLYDPERMPEWALDEFAYNHGMEWYDRTASVEVKRRWVRDANYMRYCIGTKEAVRHLLLGFYDYCALEEWFDYEGKPYEFRVDVSGDTDEELEKWAKRAVSSVKNLRSIFGAFAHTNREALNLAQRDTFWLLKFGFPGMADDELYLDHAYSALYEPDGIELRTRGAHTLAEYRAAGDADTLHRDDVQEGQYEGEILDARAAHGAAYSAYRTAGDVDLRFGGTRLDAGERDKFAYSALRTAGDVDLRFGGTRLEAGTKNAFASAEYPMPGETEEIARDAETQVQRSADEIEAETGDSFAYPAYRAPGKEEDNADGNADAGTNDGSMRAGDKWGYGYTEYRICGDDDAL